MAVKIAWNCAGCFLECSRRGRLPQGILPALSAKSGRETKNGGVRHLAEPRALIAIRPRLLFWRGAAPARIATRRDHSRVRIGVAGRIVAGQREADADKGDVRGEGSAEVAFQQGISRREGPIAGLGLDRPERAVVALRLCNWTRHGETAVQLALLRTTALQWTVPSALHSMFTSGI